MTAEEAFKLSEKRAIEIAEEKRKEFQERVDKGLYKGLFFLIKEATEKGEFTVEVHEKTFHHPEIVKNFAMDMKRLGYQVQKVKEGPGFLLVGWAHQFEELLKEKEDRLLRNK